MKRYLSSRYFISNIRKSKMEKKGFTLIEIIAALIIFAILFAILVPNVSMLIRKATKSAFEIDAKRLLEQLEYKSLEDLHFDATAVNEEYLTSINISTDNYSSVRVGIINNNDYIIIEGKEKWANLKACGTKMKMSIVDFNDTTTCQAFPVIEDYAEEKGVNKPKLTKGMTPIKWNGSSWTNTTVDDSEWYNYSISDKKWANARTADGSFWVWIPRYAYRITGGYHTNTIGSIDIKFLRNKTNVASDNNMVDTAPTYSGSSQTNYVPHPAFTFGNVELTGIWVAKFEPSGTSSSIESKPGALAFKSEPIGGMFTVSRSMETNNRYGWGTTGLGINTHMMKNTEWGAIAYISYSSFGKGETIAPNLNVSYYTGGGVGNAYVSTTAQSTTGNIYGIYDTTGGNMEYVSGYVNNAYAAEFGANIINAESKYKDEYALGSSDAADLNYGANSSKIGDALYEVSSTYSSSWTGSYPYFIMPTGFEPWMIRGGCNPDGICLNLFDMAIFNGNNLDADANDYYTFRPIILIEKEL